MKFTQISSLLEHKLFENVSLEAKEEVRFYYCSDVNCAKKYSKCMNIIISFKASFKLKLTKETFQLTIQEFK